jgi:hypothetical protein
MSSDKDRDKRTKKNQIDELVPRGNLMQETGNRTKVDEQALKRDWKLNDEQAICSRWWEKKSGRVRDLPHTPVAVTKIKERAGMTGRIWSRSTCAQWNQAVTRNESGKSVTKNKSAGGDWAWRKSRHQSAAETEPKEKPEWQKMDLDTLWTKRQKIAPIRGQDTKHGNPQATNEASLRSAHKIEMRKTNSTLEK